MERKEHLSPILRQELDKPLELEEGPSYGERLSGLNIDFPPRLKELAKYTPLILGPFLTACGSEVMPEKKFTPPLADNTRAEVQIPSEVLAEQKKFDQKINEINQEQYFIVNDLKQLAAEIRQQGNLSRLAESNADENGQQEERCTPGEYKPCYTEGEICCSDPIGCWNNPFACAPDTAVYGECVEQRFQEVCDESGNWKLVCCEEESENVEDPTLQQDTCEVIHVSSGATIWEMCKERVPEDVAGCTNWVLEQNIINNPKKLRASQPLIIPVEGKGIPEPGECQFGVGGDLMEGQVSLSPIEFGDIPDVPRGSACGIRITPETVLSGGFVLNSEFQEVYNQYKETLGLPITNQIGELAKFEAARQFFTHGVLASHVGSVYPDVDLVRDEGLIKRIPIGWRLLNNRLQRKEPSPYDSEWVNPGDYQIDPRMSNFYEQKGGEAVLGIPVSFIIDIGDEEFVQWTTFARLRYKKGQVGLDPLGKEYFEMLKSSNPALQKYILFSGFKYHPEKIVRISPTLDQELRQRAENLLSFASQETGEFCFDNSSSEIARDFWVYVYHNGEIGSHGEVLSAPMPSFERIYSTLAAHEFDYLRNPIIQMTVQEMEASEAMVTLNKLLGENVNPALFREGIVPRLPETKEEILDSVIFAGGKEALGGGLGYENHPLLWGRYDRRELVYEEAGRIFVNQYTHEAIHSFLQHQRAEHLEGVDWWTPSPEARLVHGLHFIAEDMAERATGLGGSEPPPPLVFVYGVLKEGGVDNPLGELLSSMAAGSCLVSYDEVRGDYPPLAEIFAHDDWRQLSPEIQIAIERIHQKYKDEFIGSYMSPR